MSAVQQFNQPVVHVISVFFDSHLDLKQHISTIVLLSAEATAYCATITTTGCSTPSFAFVRVMPPGLLQLANGRTAVMCIQYLQSIQNAAARLFGGVSKRGSVFPVLRDDLHWLPIKQQIDFKIGVLSFKAINGLAPQYLSRDVYSGCSYSGTVS